jgi:putative sterol carrier protein
MADPERLRPLIGAGALDVGATLEVAVERAAAAGLEGTVQLTLVEEAEPRERTWHVDLKRKSCREVKGGQRSKKGGQRSKADVELIMSPATWTEIAAGKLGPMEAFGAGRMRIAGDAHKAQTLYEPLLAEPAGE